MLSADVPEAYPSGELLGRVLFYGHSAGLAGAERSMLSLCESLVRRGNEVVVLLHGRGPLIQLLRRVGVRDIGVLPSAPWLGIDRVLFDGIPRLAAALGAVPRFARIVKSIKPNLIIVNSAVRPTMLFAGWVCGVPVVQFVRESIGDSPELRSAVPRPLIAWMLHRFSTVVVAVSEYVAGQLKGHVVVSYPDVGLSLRPSSAAVPTRAVGDGADGLQVVMLGRLAPEKSTLDAIQAVHGLIARGHAVQLRLVGSGSERYLSKLRLRVEQLKLHNHVAFVGESLDVRTELMAADVSLVLSRYEAYGRVTVESVLAGTPVVGYARGGTAEILARGGGVLVEPNVKALTEALELLAVDKLKLAALAESCSGLVVSNGVVGNADRTVDVISSIISGVPGRACRTSRLLQYAGGIRWGHP